MRLMSQNGQAGRSERHNHVDLQNNMLAEQENAEELLLLRLLCEKAGIQTGRRRRTAYEEATRPDEIVPGANRRLGRAVSLRQLSKTKYNRVRQKQGHEGPYLPMIYEACGEQEQASEYRHGLTQEIPSRKALMKPDRQVS